MSKALRIVLACAYAIGGLAALTMAWLPVESTLDRFLYEDFFYYLRVAENVLDGHGVSFDGVAPTNGFHPLWALICVGARAVSSHEVAPHLVLTVAALLHVAQSVLLWRIVRRFGSNGLAHGVALFHLLNWRVLATNLCGLETPLAGVAVLAIVACLLDRRERRGLAGAAALGGLLAFAVLARFDLLLLAGAVLVWVLRERDDEESPRKAWGRAALAAGVLLLLLLPWFAWSLRQSGTLLPNSRIAVALDTQNRWDPSQSLAENLHGLRLRMGWVSWWLADSANLFGVLPVVLPEDRKIGGGLMALVLLAAAAGLLRSPPGRERRLAWFLGAWALAHLGYYCLLVRAEIRYLLPAFLVLLVLLARGAARLLSMGATNGGATDRGATMRVRLVACLCGLVCFANSTIAGVAAYQRRQGTGHMHSAHRDLHEMALWLREQVPPDVVVGSLNAGILGFFSGHVVVNLDGVINDEALRAMQERRLYEYAERRKVGLFVDLEGAVADFMIRFGPGGNPIQAFPVVHRSGIVTAKERTR